MPSERAHRRLPVEDLGSMRPTLPRRSSLGRLVHKVRRPTPSATRSMKVVVPVRSELDLLAREAELILAELGKRRI